MDLEVSFEGVHSTAGSNVGCEFQVCGAATEKDRRANPFIEFSNLCTLSVHSFMQHNVTVNVNSRFV